MPTCSAAAGPRLYAALPSVGVTWVFFKTNP